MSIFSVSISMSSESRSIDELTALAGVAPTRASVKGARRSLRTAPHKVYDRNHWNRKSGVKLDSWTLSPHWPDLEPILQSLAVHDLSGVEVKLSIGTNASGTGFAFDLEPDQIALLARAGCGVWIDSYDANHDTNDLPDDYPNRTSVVMNATGPV